MTGEEIVGALLRDHAPLTAMVPLAWIKADALPENAILPALIITDISRNVHQTLRRGNTVRLWQRVGVTVRARNGNERRNIMDLVVAACADWTGDMAGATGIAITELGRGPGLVGVGNTYEQTQDFRVSFERST